MKQLFVGILFCLLSSYAISQVVEPPIEYSAEIYQVYKGKLHGEGKINVGKRGAFIDLVTKGIHTVQLHQFDKKVFWIATDIPEGGLPVYFEKKEKFLPIIHQNWWDFKEDCTDDGEFDGHPVKKCQVEGEFLGKKETGTFWRAQDLKGTVIRCLAKKGKAEYQIKNIQVGPQPAEMFATPEGVSEDPEGGTGEAKKSLGGLKDIFK
ncbi:MAG: hypothetical protein HYY44_01130 [Deltaproteobacteria bacterium]|nr:hypothetical protein [Deltaproteobacteria bacterium]